MPNWVFNSVVISGDKVSLDKLQAQLNKPVTKYYPDSSFNKETQQWEDTPAVQNYSNPVFSFWNVIAPTDLDTYFATQRFTPPAEGETIMDKVVREMGVNNDWYNWNCRHWGTKWDIAVRDDDKYATTRLEITDDGSLMYHFETAWSPVLEIFEILSQQYPELEFQYEYEEEQGWGGECIWENGELSYQREYDIPESHADFLALEHRNCYCEFDDSESWFEDCPVDKDVYEWNGRNWVEKATV